MGTWATEIKVKEGVPGVLEKGDVVRILMKIEWGLNKNVQLVQMSFCLRDKTLGESKSLVGWDGEKQHVFGVGFGSDGVHDRTIYAFEDHAMLMTSRGVTAEGKITESVFVFKRINDETFTVQRTKITQQGEKKPDEEVVTWSRSN